ncbi:Serine protease, subtilisin family [Lentzea albidocapillata subsp. violacea]|uniref:Serine protease, subtilisin family n=1 Tax=Lentzea albidocapillata subsp. violacea TaxID=128104 RepID=A0A1G9R0Z9_9PSEU|nr:S8 family peptidase [Lentzea albidocapillata]SDM16780.1 Serine protease, subtilisin family [Lentzea albidocapillata subsp. violacea]
MQQSRNVRFLVGVGIVSTVAVSLLTVPAQAAEGEIRSADAAEKVPGSYVVKLKDTPASVSATEATANAVAARNGGGVDRVFGTALRGFTVKLSERQAKRLAADPAVEYVEQDQVFRAGTTQSNPPSWGLDRIDQASRPLSGSYNYTSTGSGVNVYVIDTGVRISHSTFGGRARNGYDFVDGDAVAQDGNGHGTHVAGTIAGSTYGVAKAATVYGVRVLDDDGSGTTAGVVAGIDWVTANAIKPAVANMSLGGGASSTIDAAVNRSIAAGVTYAVAAGNSNANASSYSPARVAAAITVGATTSTDARASYSNYGSVLDIFAPGSSITSAWSTSDTATSTISGTSMAAPHVAGVVARYLQNNRSATPAQVSSALTSGATTGKVTGAGSGSPNRLLYLAPSA